MKTLLLALLLLPLAYSQQTQPVSTPQPNCVLLFTFQSAGNSQVFDNRQVGCMNFTATASVPTVVSALSLLIQTAQDNGSLNCSTCTWGTFAAATGANPIVTFAAGGGNATFTTAVGTAYPDFLRVQLTSVTPGSLGTNRIFGKLFSSIAGGGSGGGGGGGSGCPGTIGTPCVVVGPTAAGSLPTTSPVLVAGQDFTTGNIQTLFTDGNNGLLLGGASEVPVISPQTTLKGLIDATGAALSVQTISEMLTGDGSSNTFQQAFACTNQALVTLTDGTLTALVPVSAGKSVRACQVHATTSGAGETISLIQGTGVACAAGTTAIDAYLAVTAFTTDYGPSAALTTTTSNGLCVQQSGGAQTAKVWVSYAQF
jgi:hypothetical protein